MSYYHRHLIGGDGGDNKRVSHHSEIGAEHGGAPRVAEVGTRTGTGTATAGYGDDGGEHHQMHTLSNHGNGNRDSGYGNAANGWSNGNTPGTEGAQTYDLPYPDRPPRETPRAGYGEYVSGSSQGYGV